MYLLTGTRTELLRHYLHSFIPEMRNFTTNVNSQMRPVYPHDFLNVSRIRCNPAHMQSAVTFFRTAMLYKIKFPQLSG